MCVCGVESDLKYMTVRALAIDVGIVNMAWVCVEIDPPRKMRVIDFALVDITVMRHRVVPLRQCCLQHSNTLTDRILHFIQEYKDLFLSVDIILIEQQPIMGHTAVEQLIFREFRDKAILVSPVSIHKYMGIRNMNYDERKEHVVDRVLSLSSHSLSDELRERINKMPRKHDICDAICMVIYWKSKIMQEQPRVVTSHLDFVYDSTSDNPFDIFRYTGPSRRNK